MTNQETLATREVAVGASRQALPHAPSARGVWR